MRDALALYGRYLGISIRGQMQYRVSFLLASFGQFLATGIEFLGVWALFDRFGAIRGWSLAEVALFYGIANVAFAFADAFSTGFDQLGDFIRRGEFDRVLLRPRSAVLQLAGHELALRRVGRLAQGLVVFGWALSQLDVTWSALDVLVLFGAVLGGICLFLGLFVVQGTLTFWTVESLEIVNTVTYGGVTTAQYPLAIYAAWFRRFFTFVVPLACIAYFPVVATLERVDPLGTPLWFQRVAPLLGVAFFGLTLRIFGFGVRHYTSTGS